MLGGQISVFLLKTKNWKFDLRARGDPLFFTLFFIEFVKIRLDNNGNLIFRKIANRSSIPDRSAIFRKFKFPLLSRRILIKSMKHHVKKQRVLPCSEDKFPFFAEDQKLEIWPPSKGGPFVFYMTFHRFC